jgi:hypothetical protein
VPRRLAALLLAGLVLTACGAGSSPSPTAETPTDAPSAAPAATPTQEPTEAPTPTAAAVLPDDALAALAAYAALLERDDLSYRLEQTGTMEIAGFGEAPLRYALAVSGDSFEADGEALGQEIRLVAIRPNMWVFSQGEWVEVPYDITAVEDVTGSFDYVGDAETLELVDTSEDGGLTVYHFRATARREYQTRAMADQDVVGEIGEFEVRIREDGVPLRMTFTSEAEGEVGGTDRVITSETVVVFSDWGEAIEIVAPAD